MVSYKKGKLQTNDFSKSMIYVVALNVWQSYHDFAYGYFEKSNTGYLTFIQKLR